MTISTFKAFKPNKISKNVNYKKFIDHIFLNENDTNRQLSLCSNCGYPYGRHMGSLNTCPTKDNVRNSKLCKTLKPVKHG